MKLLCLILTLAAALLAGPAAAQQSIRSNTVTVALGTTDEVLSFLPGGARTFGATVVVGGQALDAFQINVKYHADDSFHTVYDTAAEFTTPIGILIGTSGDLTTAAVGSHWFILETRGVYAVQIKASSGNAAGSAVTIRGVLTQ